MTNETSYYSFPSRILTNMSAFSHYNGSLSIRWNILNKELPFRSENECISFFNLLLTIHTKWLGLLWICLWESYFSLCELPAKRWKWKWSFCFFIQCQVEPYNSHPHLKPLIPTPKCILNVCFLQLWPEYSN